MGPRERGLPRPPGHLSVIHAELILGGFFTGAFIGFFWHPLAAVLAMLTVALVAFRSRPEVDQR